jgi:hypothetical protein
LDKFSRPLNEIGKSVIQKAGPYMSLPLKELTAFELENEVCQ